MPQKAPLDVFVDHFHEGYRMKSFLFKLILSALAFAFVLPMIPGIHFHGGIVMALAMALFFGIMLWVVDLIAIALSAMLTFSTFGLALLVLLPLWFFGFWILPAVALKMLSDIMPHSLMISGWFPAIIGGLVMMFIGMVTSEFSRSRPLAT